MTRSPLLAAFALLLAAGMSAAEPLVLRVGTEVRQPPWAFVPGQDLSQEDFRKTPVLGPGMDKKLVGLDIDTVQALARRMGATVKIVPWVWWDLEKGLLDKQFDVIVSSWTPTPKTPPEIAAEPYWEWGLILAVRAEDRRMTGFSDLGGRRVGHYRDPAVERSLLALGNGATFVPSDDPEALFEQLRKKELDAVVFDAPYVRWKVGGDKAFQVVGQPLNRLSYHVGVRRADTDLLQRVQTAVRAMVASGEIAEIRKKWESPGAPR